jgi:hypothetical protein
MLSVVYAECHRKALYDECHYAECSAWCRGAHEHGYISYSFSASSQIAYNG